jgi:hypothetical protein
MEPARPSEVETKYGIWCSGAAIVYESLGKGLEKSFVFVANCRVTGLEIHLKYLAGRGWGKKGATTTKGPL